MSDPGTVLDYWLGTVGPDGWYTADEAVDAAITAQFGTLWQVARQGGLDHWVEDSTGALAFLILTDQFPRNMFRGLPEAFATDPAARAAARRAIAAGWDLGVPEPERQFFYLPFEHSEEPADHILAVRYMTDRMSGGTGALHARAHQEIIRLFGRFPFRNAALGRESTDEERAFLADGGYGAIVRKLQA
mgnify:FL=1|tara:strand:- start:3676 stop:4242 length:567 start_codon:yes stop_codon:yes gene_type:complete